jgi:formate C-acetyltransferase
MNVTQRIDRLRSIILDAKPEICPERARYFTESMKSTEGEPIAIRRAKGFYNVLDKMSIYVLDGDLVVGNQASKPKASPIFPEYSTEWLIEEFNGHPYYFHERPGDKFYYTEDTKAEILDILGYWRGKSLFENLRHNLPDGCRKAWDMGVIDDTWVSAAGIGNVIVDYDLVLTRGLNHVIDKASKALAELDLTQPGAISKYWFLQAAIISNRAVINFARRLSEECARLAAAESDPHRRDELNRISANCARVPAQPADSFWSALQSVWIILLTLQLETNGHAISLGRFDQYLWPFYRADIEQGRITRDEALELVEAFFVKANEPNKLRSWPDTAFFLGYQMFENLAVGGQTADGEDAVNDVSYLCIEACENVKMFTPSVSVKWFSGSDDVFIERALEAVQNHEGGQPAFYNDRIFMKILRNMGIAEEDLHNWAPVGCIEASIPGKWDFAAKGPWLNVLKVLEIAMNEGRDPASGIALFPGDVNLGNGPCMEDIFEEFKRQLHKFMELQVITEHINDELHKQMDINAFRASLVHDCIGRGMSLEEGGSLYSVDGGPTAGTISSGDALAAIEWAVFDKKMITAAELAHALKTNFSDDSTSPTGEEIRQLLINRAPKFGNDIDEADKWTARVADYIGSTYQKDFRSSKYGKGPIPACYAYSQSPVTGNIAFGSFVGATPDGRKAGEPVNNGVSPCNGAERSGPTAVVNSIGKLPSIWFQKGAILNMRLAPDTLTTPGGRERAAALIKTLFLKDGLHVQFNVVGTDTLKAAQREPEKFSDLMVRVSGYSAYFTPLDAKVQEDIISRTEF